MSVTTPTDPRKWPREKEKIIFSKETISTARIVHSCNAIEIITIDDDDDEKIQINNSPSKLSKDPLLSSNSDEKELLNSIFDKKR